MKKIAFCNITMVDNPTKIVYPTLEESLPASDTAVTYPINSYLERVLTSDDELKVVLLVKKDPNGNYKKNVAAFIEELMNANEKAGAKIEYKVLESDFDQNREIYEDLLSEIVDEIETGSKILADMTYGPKDLPIVFFCALSFAENYLMCDVDKIIYGQVNMIGGKPTNQKLRDLSPLYYMNSLINTVRCDDPDKSRQMLKSLLSL